MKHSRLVILLIAVYLGLGTAYNLIVGVGEAPDEPPHMDYARYIAEHHALPVQTRDPSLRISNEAHQPPAYYVLGALLTGWIDPGDFRLTFNPAFEIVPGRVGARQRFYHTNAEAFPYRGLVLAYHLLRGFSTVLGAITIWVVYRAARLVEPQRPAAALLAAGLVAFNPQFLFLTASANNTTFASSWGLFGWMNMPLHPALYAALAALCLAALVGLLLRTWWSVRESRWRRWELTPHLALALAGLTMIALVIRYHLFVPADQGRLFFPGIVAFAVLLSLGLVELGARWRAWVAWGVTAGLAALSIGCLIFVLGPAFASSRLLAEADLLRSMSHPLGLYDLDTGNRWAATDVGGQRFADDRVALTNLDVLP